MGDPARYWLALSRLRGPRRTTVSALLGLYGSARGVFEGVPGGPADGVPKKVVEAVRGFDGWGWVDGEIERAERSGVRLLTLDDPAYPASLKEIFDPPYVLYARGDAAAAEAGPAVAVVGTRHPSHYGSSMAESISRDLASMGAVVVSGLARGCDTSAHRGALGAGGRTVAVLGTGVDVVYPRENQKVFEEIAATGLILSELPLGTGPMPYNFPKRNRIISGLSEAVLVVEAPERSGALMTARLSLESGREVFAVPGQALSHRSRGTNRLIKDGALLVENAMDIAEALRFNDRAFRGAATAPEEGGGQAGPAAEATGEDERRIMDCLDAEPLHMDAIARQAGLSIVKTSALLLDMELKGLLVQTPGKFYARKP